MRIYLIAIIGDLSGANAKYRVMDIDSKEVRDVDKKSLIDAIKNNKWVFKNIELNKEPHITSLYKDDKYEITANIGMYNIPKINKYGSMRSNNKNILISIDLAKNTAMLLDINGKITSIDLDEIYSTQLIISGMASRTGNTYRELVKEAQTKDEIKLLSETDQLYKEFILKTRAIGMDCSFKYDIIGNAVILQLYTGSSTHAIVPKFIHVVDTMAFYGKQLRELSLNDGLRVIGVSAFEDNDISEVDVPKTVTRICKQAFRYNNKLFKLKVQDGDSIKGLSRDNFRVHSKNTIISEQTFKGD